MASIEKFLEENPNGITVPEEEISINTSAICEEAEEDLEKYKTPQVEDLSPQTVWYRALH